MCHRIGPSEKLRGCYNYKCGIVRGRKREKERERDREREREREKEREREREIEREKKREIDRERKRYLHSVLMKSILNDQL